MREVRYNVMMYADLLAFRLQTLVDLVPKIPKMKPPNGEILAALSTYVFLRLGENHSALEFDPPRDPRTFQSEFPLDAADRLANVVNQAVLRGEHDPRSGIGDVGLWYVGALMGGDGYEIFKLQDHVAELDAQKK